MGRRSKRPRIRAILRTASVAVLVTHDHDRVHAVRPMLPLWLERDPHVYFLTYERSRKVTQIAVRAEVAITFLAAGSHFVALGSAVAWRDSDLISRLWRPSYRACFPRVGARPLGRSSCRTNVSLNAGRGTSRIRLSQSPGPVIQAEMPRYERHGARAPVSEQH